MNIDNKLDIGWNFDNTYINLPSKFYNKVKLNPVPSPKMVILNIRLAKELGLDTAYLQSEEGVAVLSGNTVPNGSTPIAQAYAGHQFGHFTKLGDGRALLLGEQITPKGERLDIQLKGSGRTPYSRNGDGKATLGPMLREYIISEAMYHLGIPTTRSLAVVTTGEDILRETLLPGAVLTRIASSHIRVGTFEYISGYGTLDDLQQLADYTIQRHFPYIQGSDHPYLELLSQVVKKQASLIAKWQLVGFVHGVMNTDNMAISGESIDFGPCAFMDIYDPSTVFSSIDRHGRYAYGNQPQMAVWNLSRFAETLLLLIDSRQDVAIKTATGEIAAFYNLYDRLWTDGMRRKLGLFNEEKEDEVLIGELLNMMQKYQADFTNTFRSLTLGKFNGMELFNSDEFRQWKEKWKSRLSRQSNTKVEVKQLMKKNNPSVVPRNHRVEEALELAVTIGDYSVMERLNRVLANPYAYTNDQEEYITLPVQTCGYRTFCGT